MDKDNGKWSLNCEILSNFSKIKYIPCFKVIINNFVLIKHQEFLILENYFKNLTSNLILIFWFKKNLRKIYLIK